MDSLSHSLVQPAAPAARKETHMPQRIGVAKAAQLLNISRHELQKMIHDGDLQTFEGKLSVDELRQHFPAIVLESSEESMIRRVSSIRQTAFARRVSSTVAPERDDLESRLAKRSTELSLEKERAKRYHSILTDTLEQLRHLCREGDEAEKAVAKRLNAWLAERLSD